MRIKSYFARSVDEAITQAREELGLDALLLNTRRTAGEAGGYEVVLGVPADAPAPRATNLAAVAEPGEEAGEEPVQEAIASTPAADQAALPARPGVDGQLERLNAQMDELRNLIMRTRGPLPGGRPVSEPADVYARLVSADVDPVLAQDIADEIEASMASDAFLQPAPRGDARTAKARRWDPRRLEKFVRTEVESHVGIAPRLGVEGTPGAVVVLVGPTGAGKTTSLVKLAVAAKTAGPRQAVRLLTLDTARPSGHLQLQFLARAFEIPFATVHPAHRLPAIVAEARKRETVLIDTPGYAGDPLQGLEAAAALVAECPNVDVHLVVPGYMRGSDLRQCIRKYQAFQPSKLLVTKLDETQTLGAVFSEAARAGLKLSFLTHGPAIPDDIRGASVEDFVALALDHKKARAQHVA